MPERLRNVVGRGEGSNSLFALERAPKSGNSAPRVDTHLKQSPDMESTFLVKDNPTLALGVINARGVTRFHGSGLKCLVSRVDTV